jgi:sugar phosphate isomerase/epimerase
MIGAAAAGLSPLGILGTRASPSAAERKMVLCMHSNTSAGAGYRGALEGWAKAGIKNVELNALFIDDFLKTDTIDGARKVLTDNGLTLVHGAVGVDGLLEPNAEHTAAIEMLSKHAVSTRRVSILPI